MQRRIFISISLVLISVLSMPVMADSGTNGLIKCFSDSTTGRDRKNLAKWLFTLMALHPDVANISAISTKDREETEKSVGLLFNRLFTETCRAEVKASFSSGDTSSAVAAFEYLGRLAMQELIADENVKNGFSNVNKYIDFKSLQ